jgi:hypothetical protein
MAAAHIVVIACDATEAHEFAEYLNDIGHCAFVGNDTGNLIDGYPTSNYVSANLTMQSLWNAYCETV